MSIDYIAVLDHDHLDNGLFLKTFANALAKHQHRGLIIHSDSQYTDRIIQTGVMRDDARKRAIKDLNNRLIALLADEGVSAIGLNGYQRELISMTNGNISVDVEQLKKLPEQPVLLLSSLIYSHDSQQPVSAPLADVTASLQEALNVEHTFLFARSDDSELIKKELPESLEDVPDEKEFLQNNVPEEFQENTVSAKLISANDFRNYPNLKNFTQL
ncbi:hypothetical protein [Rhodohalobacter sp. 8-1]|uniref:hypothetical protein n=1 Tax=Rhodohalobacter sp. 8-1 TaxID=3131972 RepID=UPI0030ED1CA3